MAHIATSEHHRADIADHWTTVSLLVIERPVGRKDRIGGNYYHAVGAATLCTGVLFAAGL